MGEFSNGEYQETPLSQQEENYLRVAGKKVTLENRADFGLAIKGLESRIAEMERNYGTGLSTREGHSSQTGPDNYILNNLKTSLEELEQPVAIFDKANKK